MKDHDAQDTAEARAKAIEAHLRAFHATKDLMVPLAKDAAKAEYEGGQKMRAMVLAIVVNNLITVFGKREKHFNDALVAVFQEEEAREARKDSVKEQMEAAIERETTRPVTDEESIKSLKEMFKAIDKVMTPRVKDRAFDQAAKLRKKYDDIVNGNETKAPR